MLRYSPATSWNHSEKLPRVHKLAYIDENAILIGEVVVHSKAVVMPGVVIRADEGCPIIIGEGTNVQDGVIMHALKGTAIEIGKYGCFAHTNRCTMRKLKRWRRSFTSLLAPPGHS